MLVLSFESVIIRLDQFGIETLVCLWPRKLAGYVCEIYLQEEQYNAFFTREHGHNPGI